MEEKIPHNFIPIPFETTEPQASWRRSFQHDEEEQEQKTNRYMGWEMTKTAHEPKRPIVLVQNGSQLGQKRPAATSKTAHADVQNGPRLGKNDPQNFYFLF